MIILPIDTNIVSVLELKFWVYDFFKGWFGFTVRVFECDFEK